MKNIFLFLRIVKNKGQGITLTICLLLSMGLVAKEKPATVIKQEFIIDASIDKAWSVLGPDYAGIYKWASPVNQSSANDEQSLNGSPCIERRCNVSGLGNVKEKLFQYSASDYTISYQVFEGPSMIRHLSSTWKLSKLEDGKTQLEVITEIKTGGFLGSILKGTLRRKVSKSYNDMGVEFKYYIENKQPHPRKIKAAKKHK